MAAKILSLTGPSGIGKGYIKSAIKSRFGVEELPFYTTRLHRPSDDESRIYVEDKEFSRMEYEGRMTFVNRIFRYRYGLVSSDVRRLYTQDRRFLLEMYFENVERFRQMFPDAKMIGMTTSSEELLSRRLFMRGETSESVSERLSAMEYEIRMIFQMTDIFDFVYDITPGNAEEVNGDIMRHAEELFCHI